MKRAIQMGLAGFALGLVMASAPSCGPTPAACDASSCQGCCDANGACQPGNVETACGVSGGACSTCAGGQLCQGGICAGGGTGDGGTNNTGSFTTYCQNLASEYCDSLIACKSLDPAQKSQCEDFLQGFGCLTNAPGIKAGTSTFDSARAQQCLTAVQGIASDCNGSIPFDCYQVAQPNAQTGEKCLSSSDCVESGDSCGGSGCNKTCQKGGGLGQPCSFGSCDDPYWCDTSSGSGVCAQPKPAGQTCEGDNNECVATAYCNNTTGLCTNLPTNGQACVNFDCAPNHYCDFQDDLCKTTPGLGQPCQGYCVDGAFCDYAQSPAVCAAKRAQGGACSYSEHCQDSLRCANGACAPRLSEGQSCASFGDCATGLNCDYVLKTCQSSRTAKQGEPCTGYSLYCSYPLNCSGAMENADGGVGTTGTCQPPAIGDECYSSYSCPEGAFCQKPDGGSQGTCVTSTLGSPCDDDDNCQSAHFCDTSAANETCKARATNGQPCVEGTDSCVSPYTCLSTGLCGDRKPGGASCGSGGDCLAFFDCINGTCTPAGFNGQPCVEYIGCYDGACQGANPDAGVRGTCGPPKPNGSTCSYLFECSSNLCLDGTCQSCN